MSEREGVVQAAVLAYLARRGDFWGWRANTGAKQNDDGSWTRFNIPGTSDILGLLAPSGRFVAIECKRSKGGRVSKEQEAFLAAVRAAGGIGVVALSVTDVEAALPPVAAQLSRPSGRVYPR